MAYIMRTQMFSDGNKRVAQLAANQILIQGGKGYLCIPVDKSSEFFELLIDFYETGEVSRLAHFIYHTSIRGLTVEKEFNLEPINVEMFLTNK